MPGWIAERPESRHLLIVPLLIVWEGWRRRADPIEPRPAVGLGLLAASPLAIVAGVVSGSPTLGLGGLGVGFLGAATWSGRPPAPIPLIALFAFPVPVFVVTALSPELETAWMAGAVGIAEALGAELVRTGRVVFDVAGGRLEFFPVDDGLVLAHGLALVGLWHAARRGDGLHGCIRRVASGAALGFLLQGAVLLACVGLLSGGRAEAARDLREVGPPAVVLAAVAAVIVREALQGSPPRA